MEGTAKGVKIVKMHTTHIDGMVKIEKDSPENFWNRRTFEKHLASKNCGGYVALKGYMVVGFLAYELDPINGKIQIWNMVVATKCRTKGIGRALVAELKDLVGCEYDAIIFNVRESNLTAHLFLKKLDFYCGVIARSYFIDWRMDEKSEEDAYCFDFNPNLKVRNTDVPLRITDRLGAPCAGARPSQPPRPGAQQHHGERAGSRQSQA